MFYPRGGSSQVVRYLVPALAAADWPVALVAGSLGAPGDRRHAESFFKHAPLTSVAAGRWQDPQCWNRIGATSRLNVGEEGTDELRKELVQEVRRDIGAFSAPEKIHFTPALPKTRSGKIMRRILRKIAEGADQGFGDTSTLADPTIVDALLAGRQ